MSKRTPFYESHLLAQAKMVDFAGWDMPLHYGSQIKEHHQVRHHVGMFDVSHMGIIDITGKDALPFLRYVLANDVARLTEPKALYSCLLNEKGGVIDDLIVYKITDHFFRMIVNAGTRDKDLTWLQRHAKQFAVELKERQDLAMIAIQGPEASAKLTDFFAAKHINHLDKLKPFGFVMQDPWFIARTGYTGEDGYEIIFNAADARSLWQSLLALNILPCGLGARDTLRLEAGLNLYGADMDENVTPFEANLGWTVVMQPKERQFVGRSALEKQQQMGIKTHLLGLILQGPGIIRNHQKVLNDSKPIGEITSGGYSPTLEKSIALARIANDSGPECYVEIRHKPVLARIIKPPFVRKGKKVFEDGATL